MWQPGMIQNKINKHHTYLDATNYWTPLNNDNDKNEEDEEKVNTLDSKTATEPKSNECMIWLARRREHKITINSGATSNFMSKELDLPKDRVSKKEVFLPGNSKLRTSHKTKLLFEQLLDTGTSHKTKLLFEQLLDAVRETDILPGLK
jgi:hypothetical protein